MSCLPVSEHMFPVPEGLLPDEQLKLRQEPCNPELSLVHRRDIGCFEPMLSL